MFCHKLTTKAERIIVPRLWRLTRLRQTGVSPTNSLVLFGHPSELI